MFSEARRRSKIIDCYCCLLHAFIWGGRLAIWTVVPQTYFLCGGIYNTRGHGWFIFYHFREIIRNGVLLSVDVVIPSLCQQYRICNDICGRAPPQKWSQCKFLNWARDRAMMRVSERATLAKRNNHREGRKSPPYLLRDECTSVIVTQVGFNQFVQIILISLTYYITMNIFDMSPHCTQCYVIYWSSSYCVT